MEESSGSVGTFHLQYGVFSGSLGSQHGPQHRKDVHKGHLAAHGASILKRIQSVFVCFEYEEVILFIFGLVIITSMSSTTTSLFFDDNGCGGGLCSCYKKHKKIVRRPCDDASKYVLIITSSILYL